jgi:2-polyprenyl-3-methyl-5-hydroxy-6-metoxy-1,4-benzoquinol methylase
VRREIRSLIDLGLLPFHIGAQPAPTNQDFPDVLPFEVGIQTGMKLLIQVPNQEVTEHLRRAYAAGSMIGTPLGEDGIARRYAEDFLTFVTRSLPGRVGSRLLEIGCGSGYLLSRLKQQGFNVLGFEPGIQGQMGAERYGVEIVQEAFPGAAMAPKDGFDLIVHYGVLEHMEDPSDFLRSQIEWLSEAGHIIFAVPDCQGYIQRGDVSMLNHEHWSYFTSQSLRNIAGQAGVEILRMEKAGFGGVLYCLARSSGKPIEEVGEAGLSEAYAERVATTLAKARAFFGRCMLEKRSLGIMCPGRAINLIQLVRPENRLRFFDDDRSLHGKFYPPIDVPVESRQALLDKPVDELLIMSSTFGEHLRSELWQARSLKRTKITLYTEILAATS